MEESSFRGVFRQSSFKSDGSFKSTLSGRSTPRTSPSFGRSNSSRTPRRDGRSGGGVRQLFRSNRLVYWLLLITLWAYLGFHVQSRWAHGDNKEEFLGFGSNPNKWKSDTEQTLRRDLITKDNILASNSGTNKSEAGERKRVDVILTKTQNGVSFNRSEKSRKRRKRAGRSLRGKVHGRQKTVVQESHALEDQEPEIPLKNTSYGFLVGPFGSTEDRILEWSPEKRSGTCDRKGDFARLVWSRRFVLIFHELSMTGAPISMMELATELLSCGATVSAVILSRKGGLMSELARRRIKVLDDRANFSFKTAMKADLVIAGSAVCASWIGTRKMLFDIEGTREQTLQTLIGSVGSKSNKVQYVNRLLRFLSEHANLSKSVLWTPATTRVASLYSAADVYVINSQGLGETFGRVTIEAMAFGLPVLGTDAGGTKEIVDHNVTGLLHPLGRPGTHVLAQNLLFLLKNPLARKQMGEEGRKKVERMYLKRHMYAKFVEVLVNCMKTK